ncbi:TraB/GumN family protein [Erythrobacter sp. R86502]|uniref:TraB/GumN family protein n=1 Tax=Erythrobacter sp. R86502 TaxID=3093846 RepID=UPI0036D40FDF
MMPSAGASPARIARRFLAAVLAPTLLMSLAGCSDAPGKGADDGPVASPLFYEIASSDGTVEGWLLGTIHALPAGTRWQTPAISDAIGDADLLVVEVRLGDPAKHRTVIADLATTPGLPPLPQRLPPDLRPQLAALAERGNMGGGDFTDQETWVMAISLAGIDAPGDWANGVDRALIADFTGRPIRELEGLRGQLSIFDRLPEAAQRTMLAAVVQDSGDTQRDPLRLQRAWLAGDAAAIEQSTREGFLVDPVLREALLVGRNRRWVSALAPLLSDAPRPLIAVGAAHLVGPDGLVVMLGAQGYSVRPIP